MVGVDLSFAVDAAYGNVGKRENVHIVQADLFRLPFPEGTFDAMYSLGVLHHTPDTKKAFDAVVPYLRPGGEFAVFLYAYGHYSYFSDLWRKVTTRVPYRILYYLTSLSIPLYYLYKLPFVGIGAPLPFPHEPASRSPMEMAGHVRLVHPEVPAQAHVAGSLRLVPGE